MAFIRCFGCPLTCPWCDEPRHRDPRYREDLTAEALLERLHSVAPGLTSVVLTGGEPLALPGLPVLVRALKRAGFWIAMETSGVGGTLPDGIDWVTLSPKTRTLPEALYTRADEIKYIVHPELSPAELARIRQRAGQHPRVWVQPRADGNRIAPEVVAHAMQMVMQSRGQLRLSLQLHKYIGVP